MTPKRVLVVGRAGDVPANGPRRAFAEFSHAVEDVARHSTSWNVEIVDLGDRETSHPRHASHLARQLRRAVRRAPDLVHLFGLDGRLCLPLLGRNGLHRVVYTAHGVVARELQVGYRHPLSARLGERWLFATARSVACVSPLLESEIAGMKPRARLRVIPHAVSRWAAARCTAKAAREEVVGLQRVLTVGGTLAAKGTLRLAAAIGDLPIPRPEMVVVGPVGPDEDALRNLCQAVDVTLIRHRKLSAEQLCSEVAVTDVYVQPSSFESFGLAALEAMALGVPTAVSSRCGIASCRAYADGVDVFTSTAELSELLRRHYESPTYRRSRANVARSLAVSRTWLDVARDYIALYDEAV